MSVVLFFLKNLDFTLHPEVRVRPGKNLWAIQIRIRTQLQTHKCIFAPRLQLSGAIYFHILSFKRYVCRET